MLTIYSIPISLYSAKLRILLRHKNLEWQEVPPPGGYGSEEYKAIIPSGNLPAMNDGGFLIGDSEAIAEYLNEMHPNPPMLPDDPRGRAIVRELSRFHDTRLEPEVRKLFPHIDPAKRDAKLVEMQSVAISERLAQLAAILQQPPRNNEIQLTLGECGFPISFIWIGELDPLLEIGIRWPDPVLDFRKRVDNISAVHDELNIYRPALQNWLSQRTSA